MKKRLFARNLGAVWILLALWGLSAPPSHADDDFKKLATDLSARIQAMKRSRVTVVEFGDLDMKTSKLGKFLAQRLQATLAEPEYKLEVVDQSQTPQLFEQVRKFSEGLIDQGTGQQIGMMYGTEVLIVGTVMPSSVSVRVDVKAIDLQTAKMITGGTTKVARFGVIEKLANEDSGTGMAMAEEDDAQPVSPKPKVPKGPVRVRQDQGMIFELKECSSSGGSLSCTVMATSANRDRWLSIAVGSQAWNGVGDEFAAQEVSIANTGSEYGCARKQILKDVPTKLVLTFPQFETEDDTVERLRIGWLEYAGCDSFRDYRGVEFDKISLSDDSPYSKYSSKAGGSSGKAGKGQGGILGKLKSIAEDAVTTIIENEVDKLTGEDDEEKKPPQR